MSNCESLDPCADEPTFEACLGELQQLVEILEEGTLGLDESIARFERGISFLRRCYVALERAEQRIEILTGFDATGNPVTAPFDAVATHDASNELPGKRSRRTAAKKAPAEAEPMKEPGASDSQNEERGAQLF